MPIRPDMAVRYPADWKAITARIRARASNQCECIGECGSPHQPAGRCGAPNGALILRDQDEPWRWAPHSPCTLCVGGDESHKPVRVVLTCAHRDHTPENVSDENLLAMCQRCHLRMDLAEHKKNAAATRARKADAASGQVALFGAK